MKRKNLQRHKILPKSGLSKQEIFSTLEDCKLRDVNWIDGRIWGLVYYAGKEHTKLLTDAYCSFFSENALSPAAFPSLRELESDIISILRSNLGGNDKAMGMFTSGGTESILLAVKTYRDYFKSLKPHIGLPEIIIPQTAHPAFYKAAHYFNVKPITIPVRHDFRADVEAIARSYTDRTFLIVASAPSFIHGVIDPILEIGDIAAKFGVGFHVDACLGGFMLPFLKRLGYRVPDFDLSVRGVTSISADLHKYGYTAKGASAILYKDSTLRRYQFFVSTDWGGGIYASPTILGTRSGGCIAAAWAALMSLGEEGYMRFARDTMGATERLLTGIKGIPGLVVIGQPDMSVFSFTSKKDNIFAIADKMEDRGWRLNRQTNPKSLHMIVTVNHISVVETFLEDLNLSVIEVEKNPPESKTDPKFMLYNPKGDECLLADDEIFLAEWLDRMYKI
jgi:glutamate/tyrosine decarboxylase-like PLP-dependent enzyme